VIQPEGQQNGCVPLIIMTHEAPNAAMARALKAIERLPVSKSQPRMIRVETFA
jgi:hypothetical protein